jgi:hypothetical protein
MRAVMSRAELAAHKVESYGRNYSESDDGYSDMDIERGRGWHSIAGWGADGWDLGNWPYVVISVRCPSTDDGCGQYQVMQTCEGDRDVYSFDTNADQSAAIDYLFLWYAISDADRYGERDADWSALAGYDPETGDYPARVALDAGTLEVPERLRGSYSSKRHEVTT